MDTSTEHDLQAGTAQTISPGRVSSRSTPSRPSQSRRTNYMMMGDNRNDSNDSTNWGLLDGKRVVGKAAVHLLAAHPHGHPIH